LQHIAKMSLCCEVIQRYKPNCERYALCRIVEKSLKKFLDPGLETDDSQNLTSFSLSTDTNLIKIFTKNWKEVLREVANREADTQTDKQTPGKT